MAITGHDVGYLRVSSVDQNLERQREGIALAKAKGKYKGRKPALSEEQALEIRSRIEQGGKVSARAAEYGASRQTIYTHVVARADGHAGAP